MKLRRGLSGAIAAALLISTPAQADTLFDNVDGWTLNADGAVQRFGALVMSDDGKVVELVPRGRKPAKPPQYRIDGKGRAMVPGLIDAHGHVMGLGFQAMLLDLSDARSLDDALDRIRAYAAKNPGAPWIMGRGWNQEAWGLGRFPTAAELDRAVADRPVWLERVDGHAGWANSAAIAAAKVTASTPVPPGGRVEMANGKPAGVFVDAAAALVERVKPQPLARDRDRALALAQAALLERGITAVADMGTSLDDWQAYRRAGDTGRLHMRIVSYAAGTEAMATIAGPGPSPWLYDDRLRMVGVKLYLDGALGSRGAWLKAPYADAPDQKGLPLMGYAELRNRMVRASMDGFQVAIHAIGDAANAEAIDAITELGATYGGDRRWRIEHAQVVDPKDFGAFRASGAIASMQPVHQTSDRLMAEARLGPDRLAGAYAWKSLADMGVRLAFGSDFPVESPDPFAGLAAAMTREDAAGQPMGGWFPMQRLSREAAFDGFTRTAAWSMFAEGRFGTLLPGMRADFILLDRDPLLASPAELRAMRPAETWVGGRPVYRRGQP